MSTPVVTDKWAGNFDCHVCRRKRLMGEEFSKKALERFRKDGTPLKCKQCVQETEEKERAAAACKRAAATTTITTLSANTNTTENRACTTCQKTLSMELFNRNQWNKGEGKSRCRTCVDDAAALEAQNQQASKEQRLQDARANVASAQASGRALDVLKAESELAALEAELVTGLKPICLAGRGRSSRLGRGGRGRGSGQERRTASGKR